MAEDNGKILIPALMNNHSVIIPELSTRKRICYLKDEASLPYDASEYQCRNPPNLAELMHAIFDLENGHYVSNEFRDSALCHRGAGEWLSTAFDTRKNAFTNSPDLFYSKKGESWEQHGGDAIAAAEWPVGWVVGYDKASGIPVKMSNNSRDAKKKFGNYAVCFVPTVSDGVGILCCTYTGIGDDVNIFVKHYAPHFIGRGLGVRPCDRTADKSNGHNPLTSKQLKIIELISYGYTYDEIAADIGTTGQVIKNRMKPIFDITGTYDKAELVARAIRLGWIE